MRTTSLELLLSTLIGLGVPYAALGVRLYRADVGIQRSARQRR